MLVRHLAYFIALAEERHFARAAIRANVAQPTLSAAIRKLEDDLGATLVVRRPRYVGLTPDGEKVLAWSRQILADYHSLRDDLSGSGQGLTGALRLGVIPAAMPAVAFLTAAFRHDHPATTVEIHSLTSRAIAGGIDTFELDGGLTYLDDEPLAHVRSVPLYSERYQLAVPRGHRFAARSSIGWRDIADERLCLLSQDMQNRRIIDRVAASIGVAITPAITGNSFLAVCAHLRHGGWASIVPHTFFHIIGLQPDLVAIDLVDPAHSEAIGLVIADRQPRSPIAAALLAAALSIDLGRMFGDVD